MYGLDFGVGDLRAENSTSSEALLFPYNEALNLILCADSLLLQEFQVFLNAAKEILLLYFALNSQLITISPIHLSLVSE